ncbi:MAG: hypothetical protein ACRDJC_02725 [Thermomicrobiales bacterium]
MIETTWMPPLEQRIRAAAAQGGLPELSSPHGTFNGDDLVWAWREFRFDNTIAADVRLRVATDEPDWRLLADQLTPQSGEHLQASVSGLAWPVDPQLRYLSRLAFSASRDAHLGDSVEEEQLWNWLSQRLQVAWERAQEAASEVFRDIKQQRSNLSHEDYPR